MISISTTIETLELEIQSNSSSAVGGIEALSSSLSKLKNAIRGGVGLNGVVNQLRNLDSTIKSVDSTSVGKIDKLFDTLSKLQNIGKIRILL